MNNLPYRRCVGICLFNREGHVFVGQRINSEETPQNRPWQMPQGGIDEGENITQAALRELKEETGTDKAEIIRILETPIYYDLPPEMLGKIWNGKYRGQAQIWAALRFTGVDADINLNADAHPEFSAWQWVPLERTIDLIVPFKRDVYMKVAAAFSDLTQT